MRRYLRSGFTLIELMIVVAIIGVLVTVLLGVLLTAGERGDIGQAENFVNNVVPTAMTKWQDENGKSSNTYPRSPNMSASDDYWQGNAELYEELVAKPQRRNQRPYVEKEAYIEGERDGKPLFLDPWSNIYIYRNYSQKRSASGHNPVFRGTRYNPNTYDLISMGPDGELGTDDDIHSGMED